jgi:hypothetical protein
MFLTDEVRGREPVRAGTFTGADDNKTRSNSELAMAQD